METHCNIAFAGGIAATIFIGICFFLDYKRTNHPEYRNKIAKKKLRKEKYNIKPSDERLTIQRYFLQEIQLGESFLVCGDDEKAVIHFTRAIFLCKERSQLLQIMQDSLPAHVYTLLIKKIQNYNEM